MSTTEPPPPAGVVPAFPYDVALQCLARIPLWHHRKLSAVSNSINSLLKSPDLFSTRSNLNCIQHLLCLTLRSSSHDFWHILHRIPNASGQDFKILAVKVPPIPVQSFRPKIVLLGTKIYVLGGFLNGVPSTDVWVLDCRFNTWERGPSMPMWHEYFEAGVVDGKIYVIQPRFSESFDPVSGRWEEYRDDEEWMVSCFVVGGRFYATVYYSDGKREVTELYDPTKKSWKGLGKDENRLCLDFCYRKNACVIDGVLYYCGFGGNVRRFDVEIEVDKDLRGINNKELIFPGGWVANLGGRLVVVWKKGEKKKRKEKEEKDEIWYAEIELMNLGEGDLRGRILFSQKVLSASSRSKFVHFDAVSL
ncbi:hypothetical protein UlMin_044913 [Ulmus minor]